MKKTIGQHANYQLFPFTMLKIMGVFFVVRTFTTKEKGGHNLEVTL
jgi:hypothetical protein